VEPLRITPNEALNAILNLPSLNLAGMEGAKSVAIRLRDTGQSKAQLYGRDKNHQHDKSILKKSDLWKALEYSHTPRYMGLVLDKRFIALYSCKNAIGLRWGMTPRIVNWIYTAVVKAILLYGVAVWWTALHKSGALRTTPHEALNAILILPCLDLAGMERAKSAAIRLRDKGQWKAQFYGHAKILQHDKSIPKITDLRKSIEYSHTPFEALIPDREEWEQG